MAKKLVRLTESDLHKIIKESVKKVLKEGIDNPWLSTANDRSGKYNGRVYLGPFIFEKMLEKYYPGQTLQNFSNDLDDVQVFLWDELTPLHVSCTWYDEPSVGGSGEDIDDIDYNDLDTIKNELQSYSDQNLVQQMLSVLDDAINSFTVDDVKVDEYDEPDYD
jgi:hypothetical protein